MLRLSFPNCKDRTSTIHHNTQYISSVIYAIPVLWIDRSSHLQFLNGFALSFNCSFVFLKSSFFLQGFAVCLDLPALNFFHFIKQLGKKLPRIAFILGKTQQWDINYLRINTAMVVNPIHASFFYFFLQTENNTSSFSICGTTFMVGQALKRQQL